MRKIIVALVVGLSLLAIKDAEAQLNKRYIYYIGTGFLIDSKYKEAIETLNTLLRFDPDAYEAYFFRGIAKYNLDDLLGAEQDFSTAIKKNPVYTEAYQNRAITRSRLGNYGDALKDFQEAIDLRPDKPGPYFSRGVTYFLSQQFDKAIEDFDQFLRQESRVVDAYLNRGTSYLHLKDTLRAMEDYNMAIRTNREDPNTYYRRGSLFLAQKKHDNALTDFNKAISLDSAYIPPYFDRAILFSQTNRPVNAIEDLTHILLLDSLNSLTYFNRALVRMQIGDYNRAVDDFNKVAEYSPNNVLLYYNRANLHSYLGDYTSAYRDYSKSIELYPDFANAYINRASVRYMLKDTKGAKQDKEVADRKIAEYRSKLSDSTFSIYADTSRRFNQLLAFDTRMSRGGIDRMADRDENITMLPQFRFSLVKQDTAFVNVSTQYLLKELTEFENIFDTPYLSLTIDGDPISTDLVLEMDKKFQEEVLVSGDWRYMFLRAITQSLSKQYTNSVNGYTEAIDKNPSNPFLYFNRSATRSEMIDFISSIDNSYQRITIESDPSSILKNTSTRVYNYDEAISDLNKAAKLLPDFAHIYYNRGNLLALSGRLPEAYDDYTRAIELSADFAEAYFNRGLVQIYLKDTRKGSLDLSKAGELGIKEAYTALKRYAYRDDAVEE